MDRLDKISFLTIVALIAGSFAVMHGHRGEDPPGRGRQEAAASLSGPGARAELDGMVIPIKNLIEAGSLSTAEAAINELARKYPYQGDPYMLMGDLFMRRQEPVKAMREYRQAVDLNPDYLDKKTRLFQGKKLKVAVGEALAEIEKRIGDAPQDKTLKSEKKIIYYLYRRIAGSCG